MVSTHYWCSDFFLIFGTGAGAGRIGKNSSVSSYSWEIFIAALYPINETCCELEKKEIVGMLRAIFFKNFGQHDFIFLIPTVGSLCNCIFNPCLSATKLSGFFSCLQM